MSEFDDIRPYHDDEIQLVLKKVIEDKEFLDLIGSLRFSNWYSRLRLILRPILKWLLLSNVSRVSSILDFQLLVEKYLVKMIRSTTADFTVEGLDKLDLSQAHLFLSNHRDITLDPAFTNYALYHHGGATLRIAIGDNLLSKPFASDLMRLNKSFIVRRSISKPRELLKTLNKLSRYIWHSLKVDNENIWIAHREGRAKDGMDSTDPAIIKMLAIAKPKDMDFAEYISNLNIVPVSISYEYDPCDAVKAKELRIISENREYIKGEHEDLDSIGKGIRGYKGNIHLVFGQTLQGNFDNAEEIAKALDVVIVNQYQLHATNILAYIKIFGESQWRKTKATLLAQKSIRKLPEIDLTAEKEFNERFVSIPPEDRNEFLYMYANPIVHKLNLASVV